MDSFKVKGVNNVTKKLDSLYVCVPAADKIGQKDGTPSLTGLLILAQPCNIPGVEPTG